MHSYMQLHIDRPIISLDHRHRGNAGGGEEEMDSGREIEKKKAGEDIQAYH